MGAVFQATDRRHERLVAIKAFWMPGRANACAPHVESALHEIAHGLATHEGHNVVGSPSPSPESNTGMRAGCTSPAVTRTSRRNRARASLRRAPGIECLDRDETFVAPIGRLEYGAHAAASHEIANGVSRAE